MHPTVAPPQPGVVFNFAQNNLPNGPFHPDRSPLMNPGNAAWDPSELVCVNQASYNGDLGGIRSVPNESLIQPVLAPAANATVHQFSPWQQVTSNMGKPVFDPSVPITHWRLFGYLRPTASLPPRTLPAGSTGGGTSGSSQVDDAGFEVICADYVPGKPDCIVIVSPPTTGAAALDGLLNDLGNAHAYPGWTDNNGVGAELVDRYLLHQFEQQGAAKPCNLILAQIHPRLFMRPGAMQVQRNLELVRAVRLMLTTTDPSWRPPAASGWQQPYRPYPATPIPAIICGGSYGGGPSYWMTMMFPEDFQGAVSSSGPPSPRRMLGETAANRYLATMSGFSGYGYALYLPDLIHMQSIGQQLAEFRGITGTFDAYYHANLLTAVRNGYMKRSFLISQNDEETVSTGNDWRSILSGIQKFTGSFVVPNPTAPGLTMAGSAAAKRCHGDAPYKYPDPYNPSGPPLPHWEGLVVSFINHLHANPSMMAMTGSGAPTFTVPTVPVDTREDPYEYVFMPSAVPPQPTPTPGTLRLDPNFAGNTGASLQATVPAAARQPGKSFGSGLYLGGADSLTTGLPFEATDPSVPHEIFVGSAEGVVTRFSIDAATGEMVPQATSPALGWGAWGIALGEADFGHPGKEVIVATHRGLFTLYREDLSIIDEVRELPWDMFRPQYLAVADFIPGGRSELIAACEGGKLIAVDLDNLAAPFTPIATWLEPSLIDFKVLNSQGNPVELLLLTGRGHVARVSWDLSTGNMILRATSPRINGRPVDIELMSGGRVAVLTVDTVPEHKENIWILDANTLTPATPSSFTFTRAVEDTVTMNASGGSSFDLEVYEDGGSAFFVVLKRDRLVVIPESGSGAHIVELCAFQPMMRALDIAIADVRGHGAPDLLVSTEAGYVCWLPMDQLLNPGPVSVPGNQPPAHLLPFNSMVRNHAAVNGAPSNCNRTTAGTWGLIADSSGGSPRLEALDQSGTRWIIDKDGNATLRREAGQEVGVPGSQYLPLAGPFRGMARVVSSPVANASTMVSTPSLLFSPDPFPGLKATTLSRTIHTAPITQDQQDFAQNFGGPMQWRAPQTPQQSAALHRLNLWDGYAAFPRGGDVRTIGNDIHVAWWSGEEHQDRFGNCVQGLRIDATTGQILQWWSSMAVAAGVTPSPPDFLVSDGQVNRWDVRAFHHQALADRQAQALRLFEDQTCSHAIRCALFTPGGLLIVVDPTAAIRSSDSMKEVDNGNAVLDFGTGGLALAVKASLERADIYLGTLSYFAKPSPSPTIPGDGDQVSRVAALAWNGGGSFANATISRTTEFSLDGQGGRPKVYGVCGMAVGDILANDGGADELVIGSLDGHLLVYDLDPVTGAIVGNGVPAFQARVEGSLGNYNSIVIADLDGNGTNELYVAGSLGLRKWIFQ